MESLPSARSARGGGNKAGRDLGRRMRASDFFTQSVERCSVCDVGDRSSAFLSCDECDRWFHMACAGVSASRVREEESFRCRECVEQVPEIGGEVEV